MKKYIKQISFFLIFIMLFTCFPMNSFASDLIPNGESTNISDTITTVKPGKIVKEIVEKRERNVKHFLKDDGTYEAVIYPNPVHYLDNGNWKDIDNSLIEVDDTDVVGNKVLSTRQNDYNVKIDPKVNSKKLVSIEKDKYKIEWNIQNAQINQSEIQPLDEKAINEEIDKEVNDKVDSDNKIKNKTETKAVLIENAKKETLKTITSQVNFNDIFPNVDLQYIVNSDNLKENIILKKQSDLPEFKFNMKVKNIIPKIQKDNNIIFYDDKDSNKAVFKMQAPFMTDANNEKSNKISVLLEQNADGYTLTIKPDIEWLNSSNIAYPVTIDPPISTSLDVNSIHDTFISQSYPTTKYQGAVLLGVGNGTASGVTRSFIKFDLPLLSSGSIVTNANLYLSLYTTNTTTRQINAHKVNGNWDPSTLIWNNAPSYNSKIEDYQLVNGNTGDNFIWDVTGIVKDWYNTGNNYGLMLKSNDETVGYNDFLSSDCSNDYKSLRPQVVLNYINNSGLESYWTYHSQTVNRAGTGYINDYNGNLVFQHDDLSMSGSKMPVNINHVYNSNDRDTSLGYGNGWRLNLNQRVTIENINGTNYYCYTDEDGTKHYFYYDAPSSSYKDETGLNITLTVNADGSYIIKDKGDNQLKFVSGGYLYQIIDSNGNTLTLSYTGIVLSKVTDGAGRVTILDSTAQGYLLGITDPAGRRTSFSYNGTNLDTVTYPDGKQTKYTYYANDNLNTALNYDGFKVTYTYNAGVANRVINVKESHTDGTLGGETSITYGNNVNTFTDVVTGRKDIFQFNDSGNTVSTKDSQANATYTSYNEQTNNPNKNKTTIDSKIQATRPNYLKNINVEGTTDWATDYWGTLNGSYAFTTEASYLGSKSLKVVKNDALNRQFYGQAVVLTKGQTYTLSAYIKTNGISNSHGKGAAVFVNYQDSAGVWKTVDSSYINGTNDWQRAEVTFTLPSDAAGTTIYARAGLIEETGTTYIDCLQLEYGSIANRYNILENGDFRDGYLSYWNKGGACDSNDGVVYIDPSSDPNYAGPSIDRNCFKINGTSSGSKNVYQISNVSGAIGDTFVVSGWAKADSVPTATTGRYFALDVGLQKSDGTGYQWVVVPFNEDSSDWQYVSSVIKSTVAYKAIYVYGLYYNNANSAIFDGFRLYKEEFGDSYTYDTKGNLESVKDVAKQNSSFAYTTNNDLMTSTDPKGSQFKYEYDNNNLSLKEHNLTKATSAENVVYSFTYDGSGNPLTSKVGDATTYINSSATYTTSENYLNTITDSRGNTVTNNWNETKGVLDNVTDPKGSTTSYGYDVLDRLENVSKTVDGSTVSNSYGYENDRLKTITQNGFNYNFGYNSLGNNTTVSVGTQNLITNSFEARTGKLLNSTYGNGQQISNDYDSLDRVIAKKYMGNPSYTYEYDGSGNIGYKKDLINGTNYRYIYDTADRLVQLKDSSGNILNYSYDVNNNNSKISDKINGTTYDTDYGVDKDNRPTTTTYNRATANTITQSYDSLGRATTKTVNTGITNYTTVLGYLAGINGSKTTTVETITNNGVAISYTHDENGNIKTITENGKVIEYVYNELNEVIRENNAVLNKTIKYTYDVGGNITNKTEYPYTTDTLGVATASYPYIYGDTNWKDKLTSYNGNAITYDAIGNPLTYNGDTYTWEQGRQLSGITGNGKTITYKYNDGGIRTSKTVNGVITSYHLVGDKITFETNGTDNIYYTYDGSDTLVSMNLNGVEYYYIRNAQGDITGLFDKTGAQVVSYTYDTWGKPFVTDAENNDVNDTVKDGITGSLASTVGVKNPYRYRGYRYDTETGLYYLQSRYYNSEWGRFINADAIGGSVGELLSHNIFAYCKNNPVNMSDPSGYLADFCYNDENRADGTVGNFIEGVATVAACTLAIVDAVATVSLGIAYYFGNYSEEAPAVTEGVGEASIRNRENNCFVAGTLVTTEDGQKPIEDIKIGDKVYSENPETGEKEYKEVKQTFVHEVDTLVHVSIGDTKLDTTEGHKFWIVGKGWVEAKDLKVGDKVLETSGKTIAISGVKIEKLKQKVKVYNFEVADFHTYFVSNISILVHNTCSVSKIPKNMSPEGAGRRGAFNAAKKSLGISRNQQPLNVKDNINKQGKLVPGRVYDFGNGKLIRDDVLGHSFSDGTSFGPHFNVDSVGKLHFFY